MSKGLLLAELMLNDVCPPPTTAKLLFQFVLNGFCTDQNGTTVISLCSVKTFFFFLDMM